MTYFQSSPFLLYSREYIDGTADLYDIWSGRTINIAAPAKSVLASCRLPMDIKTLRNHYDIAVIDFTIRSGLIGDTQHLWDWHEIKRVEIETGTICNWRCEYCPTTYKPKPRGSMSTELFDTVISKAARHPSVEAITLHSYNEPTLEREFESRINSIAKTRLKLELYTNGTGLNEHRLRLLKESQILRCIVFNLPSFDKNEFRRMTGTDSYEMTLERIRNARCYGFDIRIAVVSSQEKARKLIMEGIRREFGEEISKAAVYIEALDRAGTLASTPYGQSISIMSNYLYGCHYPLWQLNIGVDGDCYICCQDYFQNEIFGNIRDREIDGLLNCDKAIALRKNVFGGAIAPRGFICRSCKIMTYLAGYRRAYGMS